MPIVDVDIVAAADSPAPPSATSLADALAVVFKVPQPGRVWVRLAVLPPGAYAENGVDEARAPAPVFGRRSVRLEAVSVWSRPDEGPELWLTGFQITDVEAADLEALIATIVRHRMP